MLALMVRPTLLALALVLAATLTAPACAPHATAEVQLGYPLRWMPVEDPGGVLAAVVAAADADPARALGVDELVVSSHGRRPDLRESFVTGPEKHVLKDFIFKNPGLAPPPGHRFGYQRETDKEGKPRWRLHCLRDVGFEISKVHSAEVVEDEMTGEPQIRVRLGSEDTATFARLTTEHVGVRLALVHDDEVLMAPIVMEPLTAGAFSISLGHSGSRAETEAELARLLGR